MIKTLGIVGNGVVGSATAKSYSGFLDEVRVCDIRPEKSPHTVDQVLECDLIMLCLPTPQSVPGTPRYGPDDSVGTYNGLECDTSVIEDFCNMLGGSKPSGNYVLRSTVPVGFTQLMREEYGLTSLCHSPEFLTARTAEHDAANPARNLIGDLEDINETTLAGLYLSYLYEHRFPNVPIHYLSSDESEAVKLFQNAFGAVKVGLFNEFYDLADRRKMNWQRILEALLASDWINPMHTQVPGPDGKRGYGGACLPKDLANLLNCIHESDGSPYITEAAYRRNKELDRK